MFTISKTGLIFIAIVCVVLGCSLSILFALSFIGLDRTAPLWLLLIFSVFFGGMIAIGAYIVIKDEITTQKYSAGSEPGTKRFWEQSNKSNVLRKSKFNRFVEPFDEIE